jgi:alpha-tubulin suppressor-like RCC1 family protein
MRAKPTDLAVAAPLVGRARLAAVALAAMLGAGCTPAALPCDANSECTAGGAQGLCLGGSCAFVDATCADSALRYDVTAATDVAGECVAKDRSCVRALGLGARHTCAALTGSVVCWGSNDAGQLGAPASAGGAARRTIEGLPPVAEISAGASHTCALATSGQVHCWGANDAGQLGSAGGPAAKAVATLPEATSVRAGGNHTCALAKTGDVYCWGKNDEGQVGDGTTDDRATPTKVASDAVAIAAGGKHTCAVMRDGAVRCWGLDDWGQAGLGGGARRSLAPAAATAMDHLGADRIVAGAAHTCLLRGDKTWCWGQLGDGVVDRSTDAITGPSAGYACSRAERSGGELWCWGANEFGQLGTGAIADQVAAPEAAHLVAVSDVAGAGATHACAVTRDGTLWCWGANAAGQLGVDTSGKASRDPRAVDICK